MSRLEQCEKYENWQEVWNPRFSMSMNHTKGLLNAPGQNNCFLNSAVQVLWHLDVFRRSFRLLSGHACMGNSCIFCALKVIFTQFQYSDQSALPPDSLRKALAKSFYDQRRFQQGHMDDAAECFENILTRIHFHIANEENEDSCKAQHCISHQKFSMHIVEQIVCQCGATSDPLPFNQTVQYVSAKALANQAKLVAQQNPTDPSQQSFAQLLRFAIAEGDVRNCPSKCGKKITIRRNLTNVPDVVSIGLIWDTDRPSLQYVTDVIRALGTELNLTQLYNCTARDKAGLTLRLQGVVCYYGKHYSTFFFHSKMKKWTYFDDAHVQELDTQWSSVTDKCLKGHYQPLLLLYSTEDCQPITTDTAPDRTTMLPGYQNFNSPEDHSYYGNQGYYYSDGKSRHKGRPKYVKYESQYRRSMTPNPESQYHHQDAYEMSASLRRAITPGPEEMNRRWDGSYNSDEEAQDRQPAGAAHFRQASYLTAMDRISSQGYDGHYEPRTSDPRGTMEKPRLYGGQSHYAHDAQQQLHHQQYQQPRYNPQYQQLPQRHNYADWTLSNNAPYRRPQGVPTGGMEAPLAAPMHPVQPANMPVTSDSLAKVNEIQRIESFKKGNSKGADVIRYQYANETDTQKMRTVTASDSKKAAYKKFGSMADISSESQNQTVVTKAEPHVVLQRTRSLENALETGCDMAPPATYNRPQSKERPLAQPRPVSVFDPVSTQPRGNNSDVVDGKPPSGRSWQANSEDNYGTYISRKTVESILSAQGIRAGLKKAPEPKPHIQGRPDTGDNLSVNSQKDSGYRSGSSGDRNSSSSSMSAESLVLDAYRGPINKETAALQHRSASSESSMSSGQSYVTIKQQAEPPLPNKAQSSRQPSARRIEDEDPYDHLPAHSGRPIHGQPLNMPQQKNPPDLECESQCIKAESLMEQSLEKERLGNLSSALAYCNLAIDELQQGLGIANCQKETRMYANMKLNTCIMRSRSLHRRMLIQQQDPNTEDQTSVSSISTDPETRDYELNHQHPDGYSYQEAMYMAQYSSDSGYSEHSDSGKTSRLHNPAADDVSKTTADIYGTLPKKGSQRVKSQSVSAKDAEVYQNYLQRQKNLNKAQSHSALSRPSNQSQPPYTAVHIHPHMYQGQQAMHPSQMPNQYPHPNVHKSTQPQQPNHPRQGSNSSTSKMSKEEIRHLLFTDFVSSRDKLNKEGQDINRGRAYEELQDQMGHMTVRNQGDKVDGHNLAPRGFAVFPPQMHPYHAAQAAQATQAVQQAHHARESSSSSSQTLQAHSRDSSLSSQNSINAHMQAFMHKQPPQDEDVQPPKPSVIGRLDKMKRQQDIYNPVKPRSWQPPPPAQQMEQQPPPDLQVPRQVPKSMSQGALYQPGPEDATVHVTNEAVPQGEVYSEGGDTMPSTDPPAGGWQGGAEPVTGTPQPEIMTVQQATKPPATVQLSTFQRPVTLRPAPGLPGQPGQRSSTISTTSSTSYESNNTEQDQSEPKTPKSILKKKSRGKKKECKVMKSISFSDNIALIANVEDVQPETVDYMAYVSKLQKNSPKAPHRSVSLTNMDSKTGYDSDFDDDTSDSASSMDAAGDKTLCNLCHKHVIQPDEQYCNGCNFYMSRLQPQES